QGGAARAGPCAAPHLVRAQAVAAVEALVGELFVFRLLPGGAAAGVVVGRPVRIDQLHVVGAARRNQRRGRRHDERGTLAVIDGVLRNLDQSDGVEELLRWRCVFLRQGGRGRGKQQRDGKRNNASRGA